MKFNQLKSTGSTEQTRPFLPGDIFLPVEQRNIYPAHSSMVPQNGAVSSSWCCWAEPSPTEPTLSTQTQPGVQGGRRRMEGLLGKSHTDTEEQNIQSAGKEQPFPSSATATTGARPQVPHPPICHSQRGPQRWQCRDSPCVGWGGHSGCPCCPTLCVTAPIMTAKEGLGPFCSTDPAPHLAPTFRCSMERWGLGRTPRHQHEPGAQGKEQLFQPEWL